MKINKSKLDLIMARQCKTISDLRGEFSSVTLTKIRNNPEHNMNPKTVGRLAKALGVDVSEIIEV